MAKAMASGSAHSMSGKLAVSTIRNRIQMRATGALLVVTCVSVVPAASAAQSPVEAIKLNMTSQIYGDVKVLVSSIGVKFETKKMGVDLIALPPDGRMFAFTHEGKKIFPVDLNRFHFTGVARVQYQENSRKCKYFRTGRTKKIGGLNAVEFANYKKKDLPSFRELRISAIRSMHPEMIVLPTEIWATTDLALPKAFVSIVAKMTQISEKQLSELYSNSKSKTASTPIPVRIFRISEDGGRILTIDTVSASKTKASPKDFDLPKGYKLVNNELQLFMDDGDSLDLGLSDQKSGKKITKKSGSNLDHSMIDFAKELGLDALPGKKEKK